MKKYIIILILGAMIILGGYHCPLYSTLGIPCPGCGITRAYLLLLKGKILEAFLMHPLFWLPPIFLLTPFQKKWFFLIATGLFILVYISRMAFLFPDTPPMNYNNNCTIGVFFK